jgi:hypothetical protein
MHAKFIPLVTFAAALLLLQAGAAQAQDNYEIQVYGADTVERGATMVEVHSNFTVTGSQPAVGSSLTADGTEPTNHALHETLEITQGITPWFETGFYVFTSARSGDGWDWVGDHIRPRVRVPDSWHWPVGASLSVEVGYQRARFSPDTWTLELRPIVDKRLGRWYMALNPTMDRSLHGPGIRQGWVFSPNAKVSYDAIRWESGGQYPKVIAAGLEYYGSVGPLSNPDPFRDQQQQFVPAIDIDVSPQWEFNFGVGVGVSQATDHLIVKGIVGRRFDFGRRGKKGKGDLGLSK